MLFSSMLYIWYPSNLSIVLSITLSGFAMYLALKNQDVNESHFVMEEVVLDSPKKEENKREKNINGLITLVLTVIACSYRMF